MKLFTIIMILFSFCSSSQAFEEDYTCVDTKSLENSLLEDIDLSESVPMLWLWTSGEGKKAEYSYGDDSFTIPFFSSSEALSGNIYFYKDSESVLVVKEGEVSIGSNVADATAEYTGIDTIKYGCFK